MVDEGKCMERWLLTTPITRENETELQLNIQFVELPSQEEGRSAVHKLKKPRIRGITLLIIAYKVFATILHNQPYVEKTIGEYQSGFRGNRSTTDQIFCIRQVLEKCRECNVDIHHLFIDFKAAYDRVGDKDFKEVDRFVYLGIAGQQ